MKYRWLLPLPQETAAQSLAARLGLPALLAQCLLNRGLTEPAAIGSFLQPRLRELADPFLLPNMAAAVDRLFQARERKEALVIFGDYDVDGVTSTALLLEVLSALGWRVHHYLPHRMDEGYGLSQEAVETCLKKFPVPLLLAVDCGSTTVASIAWLREHGVDVIVLDHHQVSSPAPAATALVNPQLSSAPPASAQALAASNASNSCSAFTELCSVGLAFKLAHALVKRGRECGLPGAADYDLRPLLDLVALGTIADIVPLMGENRRLVSIGLGWLARTQRPGLVALKRVAQCPALVGTFEVGFQLAPRLNAAGRLETAEAALQLLLARDLAEAMPLALALDARNRERQQIERGIAEKLIEGLQARFNPATDFAIVEVDSAWHVGVVGIVASRVLQQFYRPTIIFGGDGDAFRGSGRSIAGFDMAQALRGCGDLLLRHGGHAMAAGVSIHPSNVPAFRARLNELARAALKAGELQAPLGLDAEVRLPEMTLDCLDALERLKPIGQGNPAVQFVARNLTLQRPPRRMGSAGQHLKLWFTDGDATCEAVWWGAGNEPLPAGRFDVAFSPQLNEYNGRRTVQLKVLDWQAAPG
ncbi:MAG TPA: single-stranded-DNA-specific exonuclease RecJ [Candidatus Acidoferrum sp.]|nr:single-stranded-DNA-specific exonuclease RecJ [Candidatus Acidoferrum sp.]